jgi:hypothetical protein
LFWCLKVSLGHEICSSLVIVGNALNLRGLVSGQAYFDESMKYIFTYLQNVIGNLPAVF